MDSRPFLEFSILENHEPYIGELKKLSKALFNVEEIISSAGDLKYTREIKKILQQELEAPSEELIKLITGQVYQGVKTQKVIQQFTDIFKRAFQQFINDQINSRLKSAMVATSIQAAAPAADSQQAQQRTEAPKPEEKDLVTTAEEIEGFYIVKSILRNTVDPGRIAMRDTQSYCGILLDDNNRKPICRLHFNRDKKYIGLFDSTKNETRLPLERLDDIYQHSEQLRLTVTNYDTVPDSAAHEEAPVETVRENF
jgi:hypothetical protein